ncbi:hypothetical protein FRUB_04853 [Fimbriiglobus ruber]|uniref:Uncharacterized protein n=2 Tax=Fimbriiglobus ruber TaxID=1908690 RepID=A0A225DHL1_9BACT|nr:hypothetical protein FRUB_04853 [Fimbriiglobus ruber]
MKDRRSLVAGLNSGGVDRAVEKDFVFAGNKAAPSSAPHAAAPETRDGKGSSGNAIGRAPLTTRIRTDFSAALKRASLQRQLDGVFPNTLQDILEEALEPWLRSNGYLN